MRSLNAGIVRTCAAAALLMAAALASAQAQETCLPYAVGVPYASGAPNWWVTPPTPAVFAHKVDDPRWRGAVAHTFNAGTTDPQVLFRGLSRTSGATKELFFSWHVRADPSLDNNQDQLYVGFVPTGGQPLMLRVTAYTSSGSALEAVSAPGIEARTWNGTSWVSAATPAWASAGTHVWLENTVPYEWAIHMHVPVGTAGGGAALNLPNSYKMWYEVQVQASGSSVPYHWPRDVDPVHLVGFTNVFPDTADWGVFNIGASPGSPGCNVGVTLASSDIGTTNSPPHEMNLLSANTFFAQPLNQTGGSIGAGQLRARFRLANWGSNPDRLDVTDPDALWETIPGADAVPNTSAIANGTKGNITHPWTLTPAQRAPFESGARRMHQCMLVELSATVPLTLLNASVVRNMDFVNASTFRREAEVSVEGVRRAQASHRVLLFESKRLMPQRVQDPGDDVRRTPTRVQFQAPTGVDLRGVWDTERAARLMELSQLPPDRLEALYREGEVTVDDLRRLLPSSVMHVYRDDGLRVQKGTASFPVVHPQTSFGYFVKHTGPLYGWSTTVLGASAGSAAGIYTLQIPRDGVAQVTTVIEAHEEQPGGGGTRIPGCPVGFAGEPVGVGLLLLGLLWVRTRRKS